MLYIYEDTYNIYEDTYKADSETRLVLLLMDIILYII